jgi:hypothetical protein
MHDHTGAASSGPPARRAYLHAMLAVTVAASILLPTMAAAADPHKKRPPVRGWHGYGFLPGYTPPDQAGPASIRSRGPDYWYGWPGFYRGRWNGGGFGPCWTHTPIGPMWNCG